MFLAGLDLTTPDSGGQCANHCAMKELKLECLFVLFIYNRYLHICYKSEQGQNSMQSELLACLLTL